MANVTLTTRKAGIVTTFGDKTVLLRAMRNLRTEATLRSQTGKIIGGVARHLRGRDGRRIEWRWWYDSDDLEAELCFENGVSAPSI